jgi:TPR repeat protein
MSIQEALANYHNSLYYNQEWHRLAIKGDIDIIVNIGTDFARSEMMEYAVACWQYVIDSGHGTAEAYSNLGVSYYYGNGVKQDYIKAVKYYQIAADKGHPFGMYNLAVACEYGNGTPRNMDKAIANYRMAADHGVNQAIDALIRLGLYNEVHGFAYYRRNMGDDSFTPENKNSYLTDDDIPF